jgi:GH15 family glucan-1,4-alpha-glucosidase
VKLLTAEPYGSIVAAPSFGLPERIGGSRNWDYRYSWIRDSSFTLYALMRLGYTHEATEFRRWLEARCSKFDPMARFSSCIESTAAKICVRTFCRTSRAT